MDTKKELLMSQKDANKRLAAFIRSSFETTEARERFCGLCGTTWGYVKKITFTGQQLSGEVCINFERESLGKVKCEDIRPDVDWQYLRGTDKAA